MSNLAKDHWLDSNVRNTHKFHIDNSITFVNGITIFAGFFLCKSFSGLKKDLSRPVSNRVSSATTLDYAPKHIM